MPQKHIFFSLLLIIMLCLCGACISTGSKGSTGEGSWGGTSASTEDSLLISAENAYQQRQYRAAADYFQKYLRATPNSSKLEYVLNAYASSLEKVGQLNEAAVTYERLIREFPNGDAAQNARPRLALVYLAAGDFQKAEGLAGTLVANEKDPERLSSLRLTLAQSQWALGKYKNACGNFLSAISGASGKNKAAAEDGVLASLAKLDTALIEQVQKQYGQNFPGPEATYLLTRKAFESGDKELGVALAEYFAKYFGNHQLMPNIAALAKAASEGSQMPPLPFGNNYDPRASAVASMSEQTVLPVTMGNLSTIGDVNIAVILPLSDNNASKYALEIVNGIKLAINKHAGAGAIGLNIFDTRGSAEEAARMVNSAASNSKNIAVIGPFLSREAALAAQAANRASLPIITISQRPDLPEMGANVFRLFLTPKHQAEAVARYSVRVQGHNQLAIFYPDDNYGRPIRGFFENEARRLGAQLTVAETYTKETDWAALIRTITGGKVERKVSSTYQANVPFTAVYLPDSAGMVSQILAQLAYHDITKMQYLGSPLWVHPELLANASRYLQGAVIPVAFSELSQRPESQNFMQSFEKAYGHQPDQFAAYGYDAGLIIIKALGQGGSGSREALRRALVQSGPVPGATGPFSFDQNGEYVLEPTLLSIKGREFILLREAEQGVR